MMKCLLRELRNAAVIGIAIYVVFLIIDFVMGNTIRFGHTMLVEFGINMAYTVVLYAVNRVVFIYYYKKYTYSRFTLGHLISGVVSGIVITVGTIFVLNGLLFYFVRGIPIREYLAGQNPMDYLVSFMISMVVTGIYYGVFYYRHKKENQLQEQKIIAGRASAQFDALKNQLDPHFLFNSLNVLTSLIEEDQEMAVQFTTSLSKVYRYVLEQKNKALVPVTEELQFAKIYMDLLKMRFEDSLVIEMPENTVDTEAKVVPLSLQLLLENAVKHNRVTQNEKLYIQILEKDGYLYVENNHQAKQIIRKSSGVGLTNIKARYALLCDKAVIIEGGPDRFSVGIPLLTREVQIVMQPEKYIEDKRYERAREHVKALREFYFHLTSYLVAVPIFIILNIISTSFPWALFPIGGWGIGVFFHAAAIFEWNPLFGKSWEERKISSLMKNEEKS